MANIPFWSGKNAKVVFFLGSKQVAIDVISWTVTANGVDATDDVCGEDRSRNQFILNYYDIQLECKQQKTELLDAMLDDQDADDNMAPLEKSIGFIIKPNDGSKSIYRGSEVTRGAWSVGAKGRTERNDSTLPLKARYFDPVPA